MSCPLTVACAPLFSLVLLAQMGRFGRWIAAAHQLTTPSHLWGDPSTSEHAGLGP
ncbi:hypothetical protein GQ53DRAFT_754867 [Thozetella sp. PMI_491]|nr:hypothetical protein GQ53DRAFT_754867 [Thozetella sp. PMI_491]